MPLVALGLVLAGCSSVGPSTVPRDRFDYGEAIARSRVEQMLFNIVRVRYHEVPDFLTVSSVITGYTYQGSLGLGGQAALGTFDEDFVGGTASVDYTERPTITYVPLRGEEFSRRILRDIPIEVLFALSHAGWPPDVLFRMAVERVGDTENMSFGQRDVLANAAGQAEKLKRFDRVVELMMRLEDEKALEVVKQDGDEHPTFHFSETMPAELQSDADELKALLGLDLDKSTFRVTDRVTARSADEVLVQTRSLLAVMSFLGLGVELPEKDAESNRAQVMPPFIEQVIRERGPMLIHCQEKRPEDPYAAIRYRDQWFYIDGADHLSKRSITTLMVLFELLAPSGGSAAPLLSLPTG